MDKQKVYLMRNQIGLYKIGISISPEKRRKQLENGGGTRVKLIAACGAVHARRAEQILHDRFGATRVVGEWFYLSSDIEFKFSALVDELNAEAKSKIPVRVKEYIPYEKVLSAAYGSHKIMKGIRSVGARQRRYHLAVMAVILCRDRSGAMYLKDSDVAEIEKRFERYYNLGYEWLRRKL